MRHIISILLENEAGALSRVSGLFSARAYNIESLTVAPTEDPTISRITVVAQGEEHVVEQIMKQLNKLVDVIKLIDLTENDHFEREIMLIKISPIGSQLDNIDSVIESIAAKKLEDIDDIITLELTDNGLKLNAALDKLKPFNVMEVVRSGAVGIGSSHSFLKI
ncbi:MAG: acetolactate synthase small subunit [Pseudomonadota bacterium]